jgi:predicted RNase H-like HicB family nuclease
MIMPAPGRDERRVILRQMVADSQADGFYDIDPDPRDVMRLGNSADGDRPTAAPWDRCDYRVHWSGEDDEFVATVAEYPSLSWLAATPAEALTDLIAIIQSVVADICCDQLVEGDPNHGRRLPARRGSW